MTSLIGTLSYATIAQLREWTGQDATALPDPTATTLLLAAQQDIDSLAVATQPLDATTGLRFDPADLDTARTLVLARATCAQAAYRQAMGEDFFTGGQYAEVSGPDYSTKGKLGRIAPRVYRELAGAGLVRLTTTTATRDAELEPGWPGWS
jgi:hypothetical protein